MMPKLIITSAATVWDDESGAPYPDVLEVLLAMREEKHRVILVSNKSQPSWSKGSEWAPIQFIQSSNRKNGKFIPGLIEANKKLGLELSQFVVLGASDEDFMMAVNSQSLLLRCEWSKKLGDKIKNYGVGFKKSKSIPQVIKLLNDQAPWYFEHTSTNFNVYALTNAGTYYESNADLVRLATQLRDCLKHGGKINYQGFRLHFLSSINVTSLLKSGEVWGFYPSSDSENDGTEIMANFCTLARTTYKRRLKEPLFIRCKPTAKRHEGGGDRTDPRPQIESVHINPAYRGKLGGKTVVVLDDYLTYGLSFGVSEALLRKAGAAKVLCVAMGKFGSKALKYDITINSDPFAPINRYQIGQTAPLSGTTASSAQSEFLDKFKALL